MLIARRYFKKLLEGKLEIKIKILA